MHVSFAENVPSNSDFSPGSYACWCMCALLRFCSSFYGNQLGASEFTVGGVELSERGLLVCDGVSVTASL